MPYMVNKPFRACGRRLEPGEIIEAGGWKTKNSLLSLGWISYVHSDVHEAGKTAGETDGGMSGESAEECTQNKLNDSCERVFAEDKHTDGSEECGTKGAAEVLEDGLNMDAEKDLHCPTCGKKCGNKSALTAHMKTHTLGAGKKSGDEDKFTEE